MSIVPTVRNLSILAQNYQHVDLTFFYSTFYRETVTIHSRSALPQVHQSCEHRILFFVKTLEKNVYNAKYWGGLRGLIPLVEAKIVFTESSPAIIANHAQQE